MDHDQNPILQDLRDLIARLETDPAPCDDEDHFNRPFGTLRRTAEEHSQPIATELIAEELAFLLRAHDHQDSSEWGLYFGPFMESTPLTMITAEVLAYWRQRARETPHPVMKARYADLLWEMPKKLEGFKRDHAMASVAINAYLCAIEAQRYKHRFTAIQKGKRALHIALSLCDSTLVERARDVMLKLEDTIAEDGKLGLWGFCFDTFVEPPNKRIPMTDAQRDKMVADLEARLNRFAAGPPTRHHPTGAQAAALRLAQYYRRLERKDDVARVLQVYGDIVRRMHGTAFPVLFADSLERLYGQFKRFGLHTEANQLNALLRIAGKEASAVVEPISIQIEIPNNERENYFSAMLAGARDEVLLRLIGLYLPRRHEAEAQLKVIMQEGSSRLWGAKTLRDDRRTVAQVGDLESDSEGQLLLHISQDIELKAPWLRELIARGLERGLLSLEVFLNFLLASPLFSSDQLPMLEAGLAAYVRGDSMVAIHVLIPQIEQALRQLAELIDAPTYRQKHEGEFHMRLMDDLLHDESIGKVLKEDVVTYLRVLLTDKRGWNVRNNVCHGLAPADTLTMPVADRVVHALLVLASVRKNEDNRAA